MQSDPKVDLCFQVLGKTIPVDHGFALHGVVSEVLPDFHEDQAVGLKLIRGRYIGDGMLDITPHSELVMRLAVGRIPQYIQITGRGPLETPPENDEKWITIEKTGEKNEH